MKERAITVGFRFPKKIMDAVCKFRCELEERRREELPGCKVTITDAVVGLVILGLRQNGIEVEK